MNLAWIGRVLKSQLYRNGILSAIQALIAILVMFGAYRALFRHVDLELFGLWTMMLAVLSLGRLADVSGVGGLTRFVAESVANQKDTAVTVHTVLLTAILLYSILGIVALCLSESLIIPALGDAHTEVARKLLPLAILTGLFTGPISTTLVSGIDGLHRADLRSGLMVISYLTFLLIVFAFAGSLGVWAWAIGLFIQHCVMIIGSWIIMRRFIPSLGFFPYRWSRPVFRNSISYGFKVQLNNFASMLSEPVAKLLLGSVAGLAVVAHYELASRLIQSLRSLVVQALQPLIAEFASCQGNKQRFTYLAVRATRMAAIASFALMIALLFAVPMFAVYIIGEIDRVYLIGAYMLGLGFCLNTVSVPYYFAGIGFNVMRWNILSHAVIAVMIGLLGFPLGEAYGPLGVFASVSVGLAASSAVVFWGNRRAISKMLE